MLRDWDHTQEFEFGFDGGKKYLAEHVFKIKEGHAPEMKQLRKFINDSYESIECFLMPHPGKTVAGTKGYDGRWSQIDIIFVEQLKKLVPGILAPENLAVKKIGGKEVTGESLYWDMQFYLQLFVSEQLPSPKSIYEATVTKFLQDMVSRYVAKYKESISNGSEAVITHTDFNILHLDSKKEAIDSYDKERKIGKESSIVYYRNQLIDKIEEILAQQNQTLYYEIETKETKRMLEAQGNETLRQEMEIQDLKIKQEEAKKKSEETQKQFQQNVDKLNNQNYKIQILTETINQQQNEFKEERENQKTREIALAAKYEKRVEDINKTLSNLQAENKQKEQAEKEKNEKLNRIPGKAYLKQGNCYLCAQYSIYDPWRRNTACCDSGSSLAEWLIEKSGLTFIEWDAVTYNVKGSYTIKNNHYTEYLYDAKYPYDYTLALWRDGTVPNQGVWNIHRVTSQDFVIRSPRGKYINGYNTADAADRWQIINLE